MLHNANSYTLEFVEIIGVMHNLRNIMNLLKFPKVNYNENA